MQKNGLLTIAVGSKYIRQAKYLAYSAMLNSPNTLRAIITDQPESLSRFYDFIIPYSRESGDPFTIKTRLHLYSPFDKTIFIDSDSLIMNDIDCFWLLLDENSFIYEGKLISEGSWYFDVRKTIKLLDLQHIPKINSGFFLFKNDDLAKSIFATAYDFLVHQKERGLHIDFFRKTMLPDEPFLSISLSRHNILPFQDYGRFSRCLNGTSHIHIDVIRRVSFFFAYGRRVNPLIIHFTGRFGVFLLTLESIKLFFHFNPPLRIFFIGFFVLIRNTFRFFQAKVKNQSRTRFVL